MNRVYLVLAFLLLALLPAYATDWPQFLGPTRNGVYPGKDLAATWPTDGPPVVWQKSVGQGFSGPAVANHKLILFHRVENQETVDCLDAKDGKTLWTFAYPTAYVDDFGFDEGPRATPSIADGRVFTYGAEGRLHCLDFATGKKIWSVDAKKVFGAPKGFFGIACSPLVESNAVLLNIGGSDGAGIVAFDQATGKVLWKSSEEAASYSSPVAATVNGRRYVFFFTQSGLVAVDPADGKIQFRYTWHPPTRTSVSTATPLVIGDLIFLSASYGTGAILLRIKDNAAEKVWSGDDILSNHYATSVEHNGFLFGIDGRADPGFSPEPSLRCVELKTGKIRWKDSSLGPASVTLAGDELLVLTEKGELIRTPAIPDGFKPDARAQILPFQVRAFPAIADGYLYARSKDKLVCINLGKAGN
ncbi:MAG TPA: PQQ-binding-like beta-propeller repeat protein [Verrucomicrobiae bacterium]|jgi:outer membrane protein assembly factor BamB|nr:PQQ-binding-like beta-propeller repeat protein [Verrucomicrobiae bacterium]